MVLRWSLSLILCCNAFQCCFQIIIVLVFLQEGSSLFIPFKLVESVYVFSFLLHHTARWFADMKTNSGFKSFPWLLWIWKIEKYKMWKGSNTFFFFSCVVKKKNCLAEYFMSYFYISVLRALQTCLKIVADLDPPASDLPYIVFHATFFPCFRLLERIATTRGKLSFFLCSAKASLVTFLH